MENEAKLIEQIGKLIEKMDRPAIPAEIALWDATCCAAYFLVTPAHFRDRMACKPGFPGTIPLPTDGGRGSPRWKACEVIAWAESQRVTKKAA
jgi:hypothetical protein